MKGELVTGRKGRKYLSYITATIGEVLVDQNAVVWCDGDAISQDMRDNLVAHQTSLNLGTPRVSGKVYVDFFLSNLVSEGVESALAHRAESDVLVAASFSGVPGFFFARDGIEAFIALRLRESGIVKEVAKHDIFDLVVGEIARTTGQTEDEVRKAVLEGAGHDRPN